MRPEIEVLSLYFPGIVFPDNMFMRRNIFTIAALIVRIVTFYGKNGQFIHQTGTAFIRPSAVMPCENYTAFSLNRIPRLSLISLVSHITPEFVGFGVRSDFNFQIEKSISG